MTNNTDPVRELIALAERAIPFLLDEAANYDDDGSNEPLELVRDIESLMASLPSDESALPSATRHLTGAGKPPSPPRPPGAPVGVEADLREALRQIVRETEKMDPAGCEECYLAACIANGALTRSAPSENTILAQQPAAPGGPVGVDGLRATQAAAVMPLIGPLLDAWIRIHPDDTVWESGIGRYIQPINEAMLDAPECDQQPAPPSGEVVASDPAYRSGYAQGVADSRSHECDCARTVAIAAPKQPAAPSADPWQVQLADALDCFWNAASEGAGPDRSNVIGGMAEGFAAMAARLREHAAPQQPAAVDEVWAHRMIQRIRNRADQPRTELGHGPQFVSGLRCAANMIEAALPGRQQGVAS